MRREYCIKAAYGNLTERYVLPSATTRKAMRYDLWPSNAALAARFFAGAPFGPDRSWLDQESPELDLSLPAQKG